MGSLEEETSSEGMIGDDSDEIGTDLGSASSPGSKFKGTTKL
jgi:hypothetical protein